MKTLFKTVALCYLLLLINFACHRRDESSPIRIKTPPSLVVGTNDTTATTEKRILQHKKNVTYFTMARKDRSGRHLLHFLLLDAMAFRDGAQVGGACDEADATTTTNNRDGVENNVSATTTRQVLERLGLGTLFRYNCPDTEKLKAGIHQYKNVLQRGAAAELLTPEWVQHIRSKVQSALKHKNEASIATPRKHTTQVAIHIRRGDVTPCDYSRRYLPNSFYLDAIDRFLPPHCGREIASGCNVTIYSEHESAESFEPFSKRGFHVNLGGAIDQVWHSFLQADVLFLSMSAFSLAPAILNVNKVINVGESPSMDGWTAIAPDSDLITAANLEKEKMRSQCMGLVKWLIASSGLDSKNVL